MKVNFNKRKLLAFCKLFGNRLCSDKNVVVQTFTDNLATRKKLQKSKKRDPYAKVRLGGIQKNAVAMGNLNKEKDVGVFFVVNQTDGKGRKLNNIVGVNAIWCEFDGGAKLPKFPLAPTIIVESSAGKFHLYWVVDHDGSVANDKTMIAEFAGIQARMVADWQSDPNAKDISRVLRLPGFLHKKRVDTAFMVSVCGGGGDKYTWEQLKGVFPEYTDADADANYGDIDAGISEPEFEFGAMKHINPENVKVNGEGFKGFLLEPAVISTILDGATYIDPDENYSTWLRIGIILYNLSHGGREGFDFWVDWSRTSKDFDMKECAAKWKSFKGKRDVTVGMGSLMRMAIDGGYRFGNINLDVIDMDEIIKEEFKRKQVYIEKTMIKSVHRGQSRYVHKIYNEQMSYTEYQTLDSGAMKMIVKNKMSKAPKITMDDNGEPQVEMVSPEMLVGYRSRVCSNMYMKPISGMMMDNTNREIELSKYGGLNTYMGLSVGKGGAKCGFINFIFEQVLCGGIAEHITYIKNWLAFTLQHPEKKAIVMPIFKGLEGVGKGFILEMIVRAFGKHGVIINSEKDLGSNFNIMIADACFIYFNEFSLNDPEVFSKVKAMLSDEDTRREGKGLEASMSKSYFNVVFSTNNERVAPTTKDSRRLFFLDVDDRFSDDKNSNPDGVYWQVIRGAHKEKYNGGEASFVRQFLERDITQFDPKIFPKSESSTRVDNIISGHKWGLHYIYDLYKNGVLPLEQFDGVVPHVQVDKTVVRISSREDYLAYETYARKKGVKFPLTARLFAELKKSIGINIHSEINFEEDGKKHRDRASLYPKGENLLVGMLAVLDLQTRIELKDYFETGSFNLESRSKNFETENFKILKTLGVKRLKTTRIYKKNHVVRDMRGEKRVAREPTTYRFTIV